MKLFLLFFAVTCTAVVPLQAQDLRRPPLPADRLQLLSEPWAQSRDRLEEALLTSYLPGGPSRPGSTGVTAYRSWLLLWKWCELLSRPTALGGDATIGQTIKPEVLKEWIFDEEFSRLLFTNLAEQDNPEKVLQILQEIRLANPGKFKEYPALAVALAVVYDQDFPADWPHHQVTASLVPRRDVPVSERFNTWVKDNESKELLFDLRKLRPEQLKFLVDAPLDPSEFSWARRNVRFSRMEFSRAFSSVSYDHGRLSGLRLDWDNGEYSLAEIMRRGGICVDQAYYAMIAGKARGLPTLFFTGQGKDGGHAWFGYMKQDDRWEMDCGRFENQNFAVGEAMDPQTWQPVSDHELEFLTKNFRNTLQFPSSQDDVLLAGLFEKRGQNDKALRATESAIQVCAMNPAGWDAKAELLARTGASPQAMKTHYDAAVKQFVNQRDLRVTQQMALASVLRQSGDDAAAETLEKDIILQNKRRRSDLSVTVGAEKLAALVTSKKFDEAFKEYRSQVAGVAKVGGGTFFYDVVEPFVMALKGSGSDAKAREAVTLARKALQPERGGLLDVDLNKLDALISAKN